jgi:hypothetical protein
VLELNNPNWELARYLPLEDLCVGVRSYAQLKAPLTIFYWLFSAHFFGLSTKFGHSIARPLDLDGHSVNRPLVTRLHDVLIPHKDVALSSICHYKAPHNA